MGVSDDLVNLSDCRPAGAGDGITREDIARATASAESTLRRFTNSRGHIVIGRAPKGNSPSPVSAGAAADGDLGDSIFDDSVDPSGSLLASVSRVS
jgi:hypothetical protein